METKTYHHGDLRNVLTKVAAKMIEKRKDVSFTLREVSAKAGVSHAAAYRHFASKRDILAAVAETGFAGMQLEFAKAARENPHDVRAELLAQGEGYVRYALAHPGHFRVMFHSELADLKDYPDLQAIAGRSFNSLLDCVARGVEKGVFAKRDPMELAVMAWSTVHGLATLLIDGRVAHPDGAPIDGGSLARTVTDLMMVGLTVRKKR